MRDDTVAVRGFKGFDSHTGAISFPIYQCATFRHPGLGMSTGYDYSRTQNPTREELENAVAMLEKGRFGFAFSTGMAAISAVVMLFAPGDHIIVSDDLYGGTYRIFEEIYKNYGLKIQYVDTINIEKVKQSITENTKAIFIETPSNPMMKITDIAKISALAKEKGVITIVDNTFLTPYFQKPLTLGADLVLHSGTKYIGGHNDTMAGLVVTDDEPLASRLRFIQNSTGAVLQSFDSWLILRGLKTLGVRVKKQEQNAIIIANWLKQSKNIDKVYYPGFEDHPGHEVCKRQSKGFGAMISFSVKDTGMVKDILEKLKIIYFAESLGGVETLITYPLTQTHAAIPKDIREQLGVSDKLLRLSVGIEDIEDLLEDLEQAIN